MHDCQCHGCWFDPSCNTALLTKSLQGFSELLVLNCRVFLICTSTWRPRVPLYYYNRDSYLPFMHEANSAATWFRPSGRVTKCIHSDYTNSSGIGRYCDLVTSTRLFCSDTNSLAFTIGMHIHMHSSGEFYKPYSLRYYDRLAFETVLIKFLFLFYR